jgi:hypothetical protein
MLQSRAHGALLRFTDTDESAIIDRPILTIVSCLVFILGDPLRRFFLATPAVCRPGMSVSAEQPRLKWTP